jgi:hypothetical protein
MSQVYVSGPVIRRSPGWDFPPRSESIYKQVEDEIRRNRREPVMPRGDAELDKQSSSDFFHSIRTRINGTKLMISVFVPGDVSGAVETSIASILGKPILVIAEDSESVPRLLAGLPGVKIASASPSDLDLALKKFLSDKEQSTRDDRGYNENRKDADNER